MGKDIETLYRSRWDWTSWSIIGLVAACCLVQFLFDDGIWPLIITGVMLAFVIVTMLSIYYRINGDSLVVYTFFIPKYYPIAKIAEISKTDSVLSAPATSLKHRIAIKFTDRSVMKSFMPLVLSPVNPERFAAELKAVNPEIIVKI